MSLTTAQRQALRRALIDAGFQRAVSSKDGGDGAYQETWVHDEEEAEFDIVVIEWGPKAPDPAPPVAPLLNDGPTPEDGVALAREQVAALTSAEWAREREEAADMVNLQESPGVRPFLSDFSCAYWAERLHLLTELIEGGDGDRST